MNSKVKNLLTLSCLLSFLTFNSLQAEIKGKMDVGIIHVNSKVYQEKQLIKKKYSSGIKLNSTFVFKAPETWYNGLYIQPDLTLVNLSNNHKDPYKGFNLSLGYLIPLSMLSSSLESFSLSPHVIGGVANGSYEREEVAIKLPYGLGALVPGSLAFNRNDYFTSIGPGVDITYLLSQKLMLVVSSNYKFVKIRTKNYDLVFNGVLSMVNNYNEASSHGWNWGIQLDYYITDSFSFGFGYGQDISRLKEKFASKMSGFRFHIANTF